MDGESKVEQFTLLAKSARGRAVADLIQKATSEPGVFAFGELLDMSQVQELRTSELAGALSLLELFAYGTWSESKGGQFTLTPQQQLKLKQLTVVSMAQHSKTLSYDDLMAQLDISNVRELEDLLISECFYTHLLKGKLDQQQRSLQVQEVVSRDVRPEQLEALMTGLSRWLQSSQQLLGSIEERVRWAHTAAEAQDKKKKELDGQLEEAKKALKSSSGMDSDLLSVLNQDRMMDDTPTLMETEEDRSAGGRPKRRR